MKKNLFEYNLKVFSYISSKLSFVVKNIVFSKFQNWYDKCLGATKLHRKGENAMNGTE